MRTKDREKFSKIESFIDDYQEKYGVSPTTKAIAEGTELGTGTVSRYLQEMRENGTISYNGHSGFVTRKMKKFKGLIEMVPVLGAVSCGVPKYAEGNIEEYIPLPVSLFGRGDFYILHANGDSMIEAGIDDGDLVLIRHQNTADPGQIVVALMEDEATLKRYYPQPQYHRVRLHPENREMNDIYVDDCIIQGVAVNVLKDLNNESE